MSFNLEISVQEEKNSFIVKDCTKDYGADGLNKDYITKAVLEVQPPSATEPYPFKIDTYPYFPKLNNEKEILPFKVGADEIESGEWKFKLIVTFKKSTGQEVTKTAYHSEIFINQVVCCVDKMTPAIDNNAFNDPKQKAIIELSNLVENLKRQKECGLTEEAKKTIDLLKEKCKCCGCS